MTNTTQHPSVADDGKLRVLMSSAAWESRTAPSDTFEEAQRKVFAHIDTLLAAAREEVRLKFIDDIEAVNAAYHHELKRAEKAEAALAEARQTIEVQRATLQMVRNYPDFDKPESPFGMAIDEALAGRAPWLLGALHDLFNLRVPEPGQALAAAHAEARQQIPDGWQWVPNEPTDDMCDAVETKIGGCYSCSAQVPTWGECKEIYIAMLAAAPAAPQQETDQ